MSLYFVGEKPSLFVKTVVLNGVVVFSCFFYYIGFVKLLYSAPLKSDLPRPFEKMKIKIPTPHPVYYFFSVLIRPLNFLRFIVIRVVFQYLCMSSRDQAMRAPTVSTTWTTVNPTHARMGAYAVTLTRLLPQATGSPASVTATPMVSM